MKDRKYLILCIDDDKDILDSVRIILESKGYSMEEAQSAEEGLKKYNSHKPDLILVDLMMEEVDSGINFVKELKLIGNKAPIYLLSSVGDELTTEADYLKLGFTGIFQKPINPDNLIATLKKKLG